MSMQKLKEVLLFSCLAAAAVWAIQIRSNEPTNEFITLPEPTLPFPSLFHSSTMMEITPSVPYIHPISLLLPLFSALVVVVRRASTRNTQRQKINNKPSEGNVIIIIEKEKKKKKRA